MNTNAPNERRQTSTTQSSPGALAQANAADLDEVRARTEQKMPTNVEIVRHIGGQPETNGSPPTGPQAVSTDSHSGQVRIAYRLADAYNGKLKHVHGIGWHYYDGKRWAQDHTGAAPRAVLDVLKRAPAESLHNKDLRADVRRYESGSGVAGVLAIAAALPEFATTVDKLDADPYRLNCSDATIDLRTMKPGPHNPADLITKVTRAAYDPHAINTTWTAFLQKVLPDDEIRCYVRRVLGVALLGMVIEHNLVILTGPGRNGKGTFYKAACFALGDYADMADPEIFMDRKGAHPTGDMSLLGLRLAVVSESGRGRALDEARMKRLTGGDTISARYLYKDQVSFRAVASAAVRHQSPPEGVRRRRSRVGAAAGRAVRRGHRRRRAGQAP